MQIYRQTAMDLLCSTDSRSSKSAVVDRELRQAGEDPGPVKLLVTLLAVGP